MADADQIKGAIKETAGKIQSAVGDAVGSPGNSVEGRVREAEGQVQGLYGRAKDTVQDVASDAYAYAGDAVEQGRERLADSSREVSRRVADNPLSSLVLAGLAGYGLAYLIHARR